MSSLIVDVVEVAERKDHSNADRVELFRCKDWWVVSQKGQFNVGDKAVYFPPDTVISEELAERFGITKYVSQLPKNPDGTRPPGFRIRAARFRGEQSFGFITKPDDPSWPIGKSVVEHYGVTKFEPVVRDPDGDEAPPVSGFHGYTDIENIKNFPDVFVDGEEVVVTEKLHGTNCRIGYIRTGPQNVEFMAGSRTTRKKESNAAGKPSLYWKPLNDAIRNVLWNATDPKGDGNAIVFGEIYGAKVQDMAYGLQTQAFRAFDIAVNGVYLDYDRQKELFDTWGVDTVPVLYRGPFSKTVVAALTDGPTTLCDPEKAGKFKGREGIVIRPVKERYSEKLPNHGRVILKSISIDYLERKGGSEFH